MFAEEKQLPAIAWHNSDQQFNQLYPEHIRHLAEHHWTPVEVAKLAASYLGVENGARVLDIGSGVGKFCFIAAYHTPEVYYYGIEQRGYLVDHADTINAVLQRHNVQFIHGNFTQLDLRAFDHFYFYNSFYENLTEEHKIDESIAYSGELYNYYKRYLFRQLDQKPSGTRLVTFYNLEDEVPEDFMLVAAAFGGQLKCWIKM